jgi:Icc-related predicted phosphoesterase
MAEIKVVSLGDAGEGGYRALAETTEMHLGQRSLVGFTPLVALVHISDTHICDSQSPARLTLTDRYGDPHHRMFSLVGRPIGNYRPNEMLTTQVMDSMIQTINQLGHGPLSRRKLDAVVITGDLTDNAQSNEFNWVVGLVESGKISPNSGGSGYQGPGGDDYSEHYWNPGGTPAGEKDDHPRRLYGYPVVPELVLAATDSFASEGLEVPIIPVHGNHDLLVQGTVTSSDATTSLSTGNKRAVEIVNEMALLGAAKHFRPIGPALWPDESLFRFEETTSDAERTHIGKTQWIHDQSNRYFVSILNGVMLIALDTVNEHGGWDGSIAVSQLNWLAEQLRENQQLPAIVMSHHPLGKLENTYAPSGAEPRAGADRIKQVLLDHKNVIAWLAGHDHRNRIERIGGEDGFYLIETCSLIDWPQEGRVVEVFRSEDEYLIATTMFAHQSPVGLISNRSPVKDFNLSNTQHLASLSRELAGNHWQRRGKVDSVTYFQGDAEDRSVFLRVKRS